MFWILVLLLVMGLVSFKLGVVTVWLGISELLAKVLVVATGAFLLVGAWRRIRGRRRPQTVRSGA